MKTIRLFLPLEIKFQNLYKIEPDNWVAEISESKNILIQLNCCHVLTVFSSSSPPSPWTMRPCKVGSEIHYPGVKPLPRWLFRFCSLNCISISLVMFCRFLFVCVYRTAISVSEQVSPDSEYCAASNFTLKGETGLW